jgi:DNA-binding MarR family transcriptional regulator
LTKGNLQSHLARLEESGYIAIEKDFVGKIPRTVCKLTPAGRLAFKRYRKELKKLAGRLG